MFKQTCYTCYNVILIISTRESFLRLFKLQYKKVPSQKLRNQLNLNH